MKYYFLPEDIAVLEQTIDRLREGVRELGREQGRVAAQSTENFGHDDACQEVIYYDRQVLVARLNELHQIINGAVLVRPQGPFNAVYFGAIVELSDGRVLRIGSYMIFADHETTTISYNSPLGKAMLGKKEGDEFEFNEKTYTIKRILREQSQE